MSVDSLSAQPVPARTSPVSLLLIAYFAFICMAIPDGILNIAWTYMKGDFHVELESLGVLLGVSMIARLVSSFASGAYIRRWGMNRFLLAGVLLLGGGILSYALAPSWIMLLVLVVFAYAGAGAIDSGLNTFISTHYTRGQLNWLHASFGIGITIGPILATFVIVTMGQSWRVSYGLALIPILILILLLVLTFHRWNLMPITAGSDSTHAQNAQQAPTLLESLRVPVVLLCTLLFFMYGGVELSTGQLANTLFVEGRHAAQETASFWISLYWASFTIGRILMGFIADRINVHRLMHMSMIGGLIGAAMLTTNLTPFLGFAGIAVMGFSFAPQFATLIAETPEHVGQRHTANTVGIQVGIAGLGAAAVPYLAGVLVHSLGIEVIGVLIFVGCLILFAIYEILRRVAHARNTAVEV